MPVTILRDVHLPSNAWFAEWHSVKACIGEFSLSIEAILALFALVCSYITYKGQKAVSQLQMMETTLFNMAELHQSITNALQYVGLQPTGNPRDGNCKYEERKVSGCDVFKFLWEDCWFVDKYVYEDGREKVNIDSHIGKKGMVSILNSLGAKHYQDYREFHILKSYFTQLYEMVRFVDTRVFLKEAQKKEYVAQLRSTLSPYELIWIYYDCLFGESRSKLKPLVEKYTLLKYISKDSLTVTKDLKDSIVFGQNKLMTDYDYYITNSKGCEHMFHKSAFID